MMTGSKPGLYWMICWKYISPMAMMAILVASIVQMAVAGAGYPAWDSSIGESVKKDWPLWSKLLAGLLIGLSVLWIPVVALLK